jgi:hypothetical protein
MIEKGPSKADVSHLHCGRKQVQIQKRSILWNTGRCEKIQKPRNPRKCGKCSKYVTFTKTSRCLNSSIYVYKIPYIILFWLKTTFRKLALLPLSRYGELRLLCDWRSGSQSVCLGIEHPCGTWDQILLPVGMLLSEICGLVSVGRPH